MLTAFFIRVLNESKDGFADSNELRPLLEEVAEDFDAIVKDASDYHTLGKISEQVMDAIDRADIIFADANSTNENVWYEIGYADRLNVKKVVCLYKRGRTLPFDRNDLRSIPYDATPSGFDTLRSQIAKTMFDLLCDKRLRETLAAQHGQHAAASYLSSERLRNHGLRWLTAQIHNSHEKDELRVAALKTVGELGATTTEILVTMLDPLVKGPLREEAYKQAGDFSEPLPESVWESPDLTNDLSVASAYATAIVKRWLNGMFDEERLKLMITSDPSLRGRIVTAIQTVFESPSRTRSLNRPKKVSTSWSIS